MGDGDFYKTRMGQKFYERTMPGLVAAVERLADGVSARRDPAVRELIDYAADLCQAAETVLEVEITPGSRRTREAFDLLRANAAAVRRVMAKVDSGR